MSKSNIIKLTVNEDHKKQRLDLFLLDNIGKTSRAQWQKAIKKGHVLVNNKKVKPSEVVKDGQIIICDLPQEESIELKPEKITLDIVYEDKHIIVINKPSNMVVHPSKGHPDGTLVNALLNHSSELSEAGGVFRSGIVHRLDKDTTGLIVTAKTDEAHINLVKELKNKTIKRQYVALVHGNFYEKGGRIEGNIGRNPKNRLKMAVLPTKGKYAATQYLVIENLLNYSYIKLNLETGRTHQIRVHMAYMGHPIVGDYIYNENYSDKLNYKYKYKYKSQLLHAYKIEFKHPIYKSFLSFTVPPPKNFLDVLYKLQEETY